MCEGDLGFQERGQRFCDVHGAIALLPIQAAPRECIHQNPISDGIGALASKEGAGALTACIYDACVVVDHLIAGVPSDDADLVVIFAVGHALRDETDTQAVSASVGPQAIVLDDERPHLVSGVSVKASCLGTML
jgi:hypothetical protein